jgi:hypothetical protein
MGEYTAPLMTGLPMRLALPFVPTLPLLPEPELKLSTIALPLILMLLQPFAVAKTPNVESEPTLLIELVPAPVNKLICVLGEMFSSLSVTITLAVATPVVFAGGENLTVMVQLALEFAVAPGGTLAQLLFGPREK